ncbi:MAG: hypothetical protein GYB65_17990 [Chloroflexi bacterium]|nr:hypothetical protein [Chloroflexota bacterium]
MPKLLTFLGAVIALAVVSGIGFLVLRPSGELLAEARFDASVISPNADGVNDLTTIHYELSRSATVSIWLENDDSRYYFRQDEPRSSGSYSVYFSGVVDGFSLPDEDEIPGTIERRLIPDGTYTWVIEAVDDDDSARASGTLTIENAPYRAGDLPVILNFTVHPTHFTPNQDGVDDRVNVIIDLLNPANLNVYLEDAGGQRYFLPERQILNEIDLTGISREFDYDGGVDQGLEPPPDGEYTLNAVAQDEEGQRVVRQQRIVISDGGLPQVEMVPQVSGAQVLYNPVPYRDGYYSDYTGTGDLLELPPGVDSELETITIVQGDILVFKLTVTNYGATPIRTAGPFPGTVYDFDQTASSLGAYEESGAWRVGIKCDTALSDFPWRWAVAPLDQLTPVRAKLPQNSYRLQVARLINDVLPTDLDEIEPKTYYYLMPGQRTEVWGGIRMTDLISARNPQFCWAGLIHEDVGIPANQSRFGAREIEIVRSAD